MENLEIQLRSDISILCERANNHSIWDVESAAFASDLIKLLSTQLRRVDDERKRMVKPFNDGVKQINERFKNYTGPLEGAVAKLKMGLLAHQQAEEKLRQQRLEAERAAQVAVTVPLENVPQPFVPPVPKPTGILSTSHVRKVWSFELIDKSSVPLQFLTLDDKEVHAAIRSGVRDIPGVRIFEKETIVTR